MKNCVRSLHSNAASPGGIAVLRETSGQEGREKFSLFQALSEESSVF